ncbi:thiamine phosphate synthase [Sulfurimonas sp.]|uniref:thiamine phosphate synthase n=1 Tax=Sulfurimonas sp. TaxID=2022749 RepID=UPI003D0E7D11
MKSYLITASVDKLAQQLQKHRVDFVLYRDKQTPHYKQEAQKFVEVCQKFPVVKPFIHQDVAFARELGTGVHLTSKQFDQIQKAKEFGVEVIISTHTHAEVLEAQNLEADYVTYSPIYPSPNKGEPKGIEDLKNLIEKVNIKVFALGGIVTQEQIKEVDDAKAYGFASIRYFF